MELSEPDLTRLRDYQQMMGTEAGNLALALDQLTDAMALIGQHNVYCRVEKGPRAGQPPLDVVEVVNTLQRVKDLVRETLTKLRQE